MSRYLLYLSLYYFVVSCSSYNKEYNQDYQSLDVKDFAKKYFTLFNEASSNSSNINTNEAYYIERSGMTFQIVVFSSNSFVYESPLMSIQNLKKPFGPIKLGRSSYYKINDTLIQLESVTANLGKGYTIIEEGKINKDTIYMVKRYNTKGAKNEHKLTEKYVLATTVKTYVFGGNILVENK